MGERENANIDFRKIDFTCYINYIKLCPKMKYFKFVFSVFSFTVSLLSAQADTLIVKVSLVNPKVQTFMDQEVALPAGLEKVNGLYHVTLGFIENVPSSQALEFKKEIYRFLRTDVHFLRTSPLDFHVKRATTFRQLGSLIYSGLEVILFPKENNRRYLVRMNEKLSDFVGRKAKESIEYS